MHLLDINVVKNDLSGFPKTHLEIEQEILDYKLFFYKNKVDKVEWRMKLPMFVHAFYGHLRESNGEIPSQVEFWQIYQNKNAEWFHGNRFSSHIMDGIKARVFRTYPSLVRDVHFAIFLATNLNTVDILYNIQLDIEQGIDLLLVENNHLYAINLFTQTSRAYQGRDKKKNRHTHYDNVKYIDVPVSFKGSHVVGAYYLYGKRELELIKKYLLNQNIVNL